VRRRATPAAGYGILFKSRPLVIFGLCVMLFHLANAALLPLVGQKLAAAYPEEATAMMSACIVAAQAVMLPIALLVGRTADSWGRKPLFLGVVTRERQRRHSFSGAWLPPSTRAQKKGNCLNDQPSLENLCGGLWKSVEKEIGGSSPFGAAKATARLPAPAPNEQVGQQHNDGLSDASNFNRGNGFVMMQIARPRGRAVVKGARPGGDGSYANSEIEHHYSRAGFVTRIELQQPI
jgi:hypothetical protein